MWLRVVNLTWICGLPLVLLYALSGNYIKGWFIDTSRTAADRIKPGMSLAEAEQIIGGPPGDYRFDPGSDFQNVTGSCWPHYVEWTTYQGQITIQDGYTVLWPPRGGPRKPSSLDPDGIVDEVRWSVPPEKFGAVPETAFLGYSGLCALLGFVLGLGWSRV